MICRNKDRAEEARKDIVDQSKNEVYLQRTNESQSMSHMHSLYLL